MTAHTGAAERKIVAASRVQDVSFAILGVIVLLLAMTMLTTLVVDLLQDGLGRHHPDHVRDGVPGHPAGRRRGCVS